MKYTLMDCVAQNRQYSTFEIPDPEDKDSMKAGDFVKLVFEPLNRDEHGGERMWVRITKREGDQFEGFLDNDPVLFSPDVLKHRDMVSFESKHIASFIEGDGE